MGDFGALSGARPSLFSLRWFMAAGRSTDAFFLAYAIIFFLNGVFTHIFRSRHHSVSFTKERKSRTNGKVLYMPFLGRVLLPALVIYLLICCAIPLVLNLLSGWDIDSSKLMMKILLEMTPVYFFLILISAYNGVFYVSKVFWLPALSPFFPFGDRPGLSF